MLIAAFVISESRDESKFMTLKPLYLITLDSQTAFDVVSHKILLDKLYESGIHPRLWTIVKDLYIGMSSKIKWMGEISQKFPIHQRDVKVESCQPTYIKSTSTASYTNSIEAK